MCAPRVVHVTMASASPKSRVTTNSIHSSNNVTNCISKAVSVALHPPFRPRQPPSPLPSPAAARLPSSNPRADDNERKFQDMALARILARFPVTAWKPDLMVATEQRDWQTRHRRKCKRTSRSRIVSGDRQVWHVTYSSAKRKLRWSKKRWNAALSGTSRTATTGLMATETGYRLQRKNGNWL